MELISSLTNGDRRPILPNSSATKSPNGPDRSSHPASFWNKLESQQILEIDMKIRLMENFRAIFYAPYYAIHALGFYANEGIDVELIYNDTPGDAISHLASDTIDLTWGGPMRVMTAHDRDDQSPLVCFGEVPTPWMCLQQDLRDADIDPKGITRVSDRTMRDNYTALRGKQLDVMQAFEPFASQAEMDRSGEILYAASSRGPTVYTAFIATRAKVAAHRDEFVAATRALASMQQWLYAHSGRELAEVVTSFFSEVP